MKNSRVVIFSDFDGTITTEDVGNRLFHHFSDGQSAAVVEQWQKGGISARECLRREAALIELNETQLAVFLKNYELSSGFTEFFRLCQTNDIPLQILSDGLDLYINHILAREGLSSIEVRANHGYFRDNRLCVEFPYSAKTCPRCGNCKGERIKEYVTARDDNPFVIFIGDGLSDRCAIPQADMIFAKSDLSRYCTQNQIEYNEFEIFDDIIVQLCDSSTMQR